MNKLIFLWLLGSVHIALGSDATGELTVIVHGFSHSGGISVVRLFRKQDDIFGQPFQTMRSTISQGKSTVTFNDIPYGKYALVSYHDENMNGQLDHNFLRLPKEPIGFSGGYSLGLFSGFPSFAKLKFRFNETTSPYHITLL